MGYKLIPGLVVTEPPIIVPDPTGTTSWRDVKKELRQWYLNNAKALRSVTEKDYFKNDQV